MNNLKYAFGVAIVLVGVYGIYTWEKMLLGEEGLKMLLGYVGPSPSAPLGS